MYKVTVGRAVCSAPIGFSVLTASLLASAAPAPLGSGIDTQYIDDTVRAQDDFYRHVNGKWLANTTIPPDRGRYGSLDMVTDTVWDQLRSIVDSLRQPVDAVDANRQTIANLYASFMDEITLERRGLTPLTTEFATIDAVKHKSQMAKVVARFNRIGVIAPF